MIHRSAFIVCLLAFAGYAYAADPLAAVFDRIDAAAKTFTGVTADVIDTHHNAIVNEDDEQKGTIKMSRAKGGPTLLLLSLKGGMSGAVSVALNANEARVHNQKTNIVTIYNVAKMQDAVNQYLALGFGATTAELKAAYDVTWAGEEKLGSETTSHLNLIPRSKDTQSKLTKAELWYTANGLVLQQKFTQPSGDFVLMKYSAMKLGPVSPKDLVLNPPGATFKKQEM